MVFLGRRACTLKYLIGIAKVFRPLLKAVLIKFLEIVPVSLQLYQHWILSVCVYMVVENVVLDIFLSTVSIQTREPPFCFWARFSFVKKWNLSSRERLNPGEIFDREILCHLLTHSPFYSQLLGRWYPDCLDSALTALGRWTRRGMCVRGVVALPPRLLVFLHSL